MSVQALSWVLERSEAKLGARLVLLSIANHADERGENAWPSVTTIAREAHMSARQVTRVLEGLVDLGELFIEHGAGPRGTHRYTIVGMAQGRLWDSTDPRQSVRGDKLSGVTNRAGGGDISDTLPLSGCHPNRPRTVLEPSEEGAREDRAEKPGKKPKPSEVDWSRVAGLDLPNWQRWLAHRRDARYPAYTTDQAAKALARYPPDVQRAAVQHSIEQQYRGLFPEKITGDQHGKRSYTDQLRGAAQQLRTGSGGASG